MNEFSSTLACHEPSGFAPDEARRQSWKIALLSTAVVLVGLLLRLLVTILPGNGIRSPWGGGGDTRAYLLLAHNLLEGKGYAYAGMPTALRPPGYPILLAGFLKVFGDHALAAVRWFQFSEGVAVAFICAALAGRIYGEKAKKVTLMVALFFPTLAEMNGEILTEATATLLAATILYLLVRYLERPRWISLVSMSCAIGIGALARFNLALLGFIAVCAVLIQKNRAHKWLSAALVILVSLTIVTPWLIRDARVFHGRVLFSTHSGLEALEGLLTPQGRALPGDAEKLRAAVGWVPPVDIETNGASRYELGAEPELDRQCWRAAISVAGAMGWRLIPLAFKKLSDFWLSTDQLLWTQAFGWQERALRAAGVLAYWVFLGLAVAGWLRFRVRNPSLARIFLFYAGLVTAMHLPFVMNTRLRMPFLDPLTAVLAGIGICGIASDISTRNRKRMASLSAPLISGLLGARVN